MEGFFDNILNVLQKLRMLKELVMRVNVLFLCKVFLSILILLFNTETILPKQIFRL